MQNKTVKFDLFPVPTPDLINWTELLLIIYMSICTSNVMIRVMVSTDSTNTGNTQASRRNMVNVAAAYW